VTLSGGAEWPTFDGYNIWVPNPFFNSVAVVRASTGLVLQTLTGNRLDFAFGSAFDGERVLVTNQTGNSVSLWKAADLTPLGSVLLPAPAPTGPCSDGVSFWIALNDTNQIARF
jgi:DNA-binding beta-propeller fold protein YncE